MKLSSIKTSNQSLLAFSFNSSQTGWIQDRSARILQEPLEFEMLSMSVEERQHRMRHRRQSRRLADAEEVKTIYRYNWKPAGGEGATKSGRQRSQQEEAHRIAHSILYAVLRPSNYDDAAAAEDGDRWQEAIASEMGALSRTSRDMLAGSHHSHSRVITVSAVTISYVLGG